MKGNNQHLNTVMVEYDNLPFPQLNELLQSQIDYNINGQNWSNTYQCITMIRGICKNYPEYLFLIFEKYGVILTETFDNGTTQNIKNILKLLEEIFIQGRQIVVQLIVAGFLPLLITKTATEFGSMKKSCQNLVTIVAENCLYPRVIEIGAELSCDKNAAVGQIAIKMLSIVLMNVSFLLAQVSPEMIKMIIKSMSIHLKGKRSNMKTTALNICTNIFNHIGYKTFLQLMSQQLSKEETTAMKQSIQAHQTQKQKCLTFTEMKKQQRMQLKIRKQEQKSNI